MHWLFWMALISFGGGIKAVSQHKPTECEIKNTDFAIINSDFIRCVANQDKNASYCLQCSGLYSNAAANYFTLTNSTECRPQYVDNNLLHLVDNLWSNSKRIWDMAVCSDCFEGRCDETDAAPFVISNRTQEFVWLHWNTSQCIDDHGDALCEACEQQYNNLTTLYSKIRKQTGDKFCFDLKNMMNQTQKKWSDSHCCDDKDPPAIEFYALSASSFFIAIFFYGTAFLYGRRKEEIPFIPDDLLPIDHSRSAHDSSVSLSDNELPEPSTSADILEPSAKLVDSTDETDDDDQPIPSHPISNPNLIEI